MKINPERADVNQRMYKERKANIAVFRGCSYYCIYCAFRKTLSRLNCTSCFNFKPHSHLETLSRRPPKTRDGEFITIGLTGDISFMNLVEFKKVIDYCHEWCNVTFLIQSKNPLYFLQFVKDIPDNVIIGTTIESNLGQWWSKSSEPIHYSTISKAPLPIDRFEAMLKISCRRAITIEPLLSFDCDILEQWISNINPEFVYIGYNSNTKMRLPEPSLSKTIELIQRLKNKNIDVREKLIRKAYYE
jgi:DNA repair photolyase